jgi:putative peptidoglycan lipid II flippase
MLWAAGRDGISLRITWPRWTPEIREFFIALGAVTVGTATTLIAPLVDTILASLLATGSRTALYYADRINQLPLGVLGIALGTVLLPEMSARLARTDRAGSDAAQNNSAALSLLLTLPFAVVFLTIPGTIMRAIFAHGAFDAQAASLAGVALAAYGVGLPAFALVRIIASTFYARHDTATPARVTLLAFAANIAMKLMLVFGFHLGIAGIALGTAFGAWLNIAQLVWLGRRRSLLVIQPSFRRALLPILLASIAVGIGAIAGVQAADYLHVHGLWHDMAALAFAGAFGMTGYLTVVIAFRRLLPLGRFGAKA